MILKKILQDGKTVYEPITFEEAIEKRAEKSDFVFTDEDEKDKFDDLLDEIENVEEDSTQNENSEEKTPSLDSLKDVLKKVEKIAQKGYGIGTNLGNLFLNIGSEKYQKKNKLLQILPFLDDDDIHEVAEDILSDPDKYCGLNLCEIMPFLSGKDCDALFLRIVLDTDNKYEYSPTSLAPFVSEKCLSMLVDKYIAGELQVVDMDELYPFLSSKDVKRLFKYIVSKKDE